MSIKEWTFLIFRLPSFLVGDPDLFQGDMRLTSFQRLLAITGGDVSLAGRSGLTFGSTSEQSLLWPGKTVYYEISSDLRK